jgi:hypothetical protein
MAGRAVIRLMYRSEFRSKLLHLNTKFLGESHSQAPAAVRIRLNG